MNTKKQAFTLVELIVVITILAILGTIAFLSFSGYSRDSRNSVRYNDLRLIEAALEQYHIKVGKYPESTLPVEITFADAEAWLQGTFGDSTFGSVGKLDHKPVDPLTGSEYTYSILNTKGEYEVAAALEGTSMSEVNIGDTTYAGNVAGTSLVLGTYNGKMLKVNTGGLDYVLAVPTIISGDITLLSIDEITFYKKLAYNGSNVIAGNYKGTDFDTSKTFDYDLTALELIVFTGAIEDLKTSEAKRVALLENLQIAYSGTVIETNTDYESVKDESIDINSPSDTSTQLAKNVIYNAFKFEFSDVSSSLSSVIQDWGNILNLEAFWFYGEVNNKYYFGADDGINGWEIWGTDGTESGTSILKDINPTGGSTYYGPTIYNNIGYIDGNDGVNGRELWITDFTEAGTVMLKDINPSGNSSPSGFVLFDNKIYFSADDGINGKELWITDGTEGGTVMLKDINPSGNSSPARFTEYNGKLYFSASDGSNGIELWVTNGTSAGTVMLKNINLNFAGFDSSSPSGFTEYNGKLYFSAKNLSNSVELWVTDGTSGGTIMLKDINSGAGYSWPSRFTEYNGKLYFYANNGINGTELWVTDGTEEGTFMLKDINSGAGSFGYPSFTEYNGRLYFQADDGFNGKELWSTDGTLGGTIMLKDINPSGDSSAYISKEYNGKIYLTADDGINGKEIWVSDGTSAGTVMLKDINSSGNSSPSFFFEFNNILYFVATESSGDKLWKTDGTTDGTTITNISFMYTA